MLQFHSAEIVAIIQRGFRRKFHKNPTHANSVPFLGFSRHLTSSQQLRSQWSTLHLTSLLPHATEIFEVAFSTTFHPLMAFSFC